MKYKVIISATWLCALPVVNAQFWDTYARQDVAIILGDITTTGGDTTGRMLVTGNADLNGGYSVQITGPGGGPQDPVDLTQDSLVVGGDLVVTPSSGWVTLHNNWAYGGANSGNFSSSNGTGRAIPGLEVDPNTANGLAAGGGGHSLAQIIVGMEVDSLYFAGLAERGVVSKISGGSTVTLTGNDPVLNIFNLSVAEAADWFVSWATREIVAPVGSTVLLNIPGTAITYSGGTMSLSGPTQNTVLVNYHEATSFSSGSFTHKGSILAPFTTTASLLGGSLEGSTTFAGTVTQSSGGEFHNYPYTGVNIRITVPEPAASALFSGLGLLGLADWWRRARHG